MTKKLDLPRDFLDVYATGILSDMGLRVSEFRWMTTQEIADFRSPPYITDRLVPFALSAARDRYAWWKSVDDKRYDFVVYAPHDSEEADVFAPTFSAFLYRCMLRECCDCWLGSDDYGIEAVSAIVRRNIDLVKPHLPPAWGRTLSDIVSGIPLVSDSGSVSWIKCDEANDLVARDLGADYLDRHVRQVVYQEPVAQPEHVGLALGESGTMQQIVERSISDIMLAQFQSLAVEGYRLLDLERTASPERVHQSIQTTIDRYLAQAMLDMTAQRLGLLLGCVWGQTICAELEWHWAQIVSGKHEWHGVVSASRDCVVFPILTIGNMLHDPRKKVNMLDLYSILKSRQWQKSQPGIYVILGAQFPMSRLRDQRSSKRGKDATE